jgi:hypothetical protein
MAGETFSWAIWSTGANAVFTFIYVFSISIAYVFGGYVLNPLVMAALAFVIPYFSFTTLPIILIIFTAMSRRFLVT